MGHGLAPRTVAALAVVLIAASFAFAWLVSRKEPISSSGRSAPVDGARAFELRCVRCHALEELAAPLRGSPDPSAASAELLGFLSGHGDAPLEEDRAIVEHLLRSAGEAPRR
jgi:hypothetical protein